ncbi:MAG: hypothetical protein HN576_02870 [Bacteriovoracaceae bacterium]|nr:hypothetical protein [Bacteriovoracaceae bacterium]
MSLKETAADILAYGHDDESGYGIVDALAAIKYATAPEVPVQVGTEDRKVKEIYVLKVTPHKYDEV